MQENYNNSDPMEDEFISTNSNQKSSKYKCSTRSIVTDDKLFGKQYTDNNKVSFSKILCIFSDVILAYSLILSTVAIVLYFKFVFQTLEVPAENAPIGPDLGFLGYLLPAAFVFAGLTHTFYYNKERFANIIKIRFSYIKQLLLFKLNSGMYSQEYLQDQIDTTISAAEQECEVSFSSRVEELDKDQENISV